MRSLAVPAVALALLGASHARIGISSGSVRGHGFKRGERVTVVLRYLEGLSQAETAKLLGCSEGTVKSQTARGLERLRELLSDDLTTTTTSGSAP